ncbi:STAS domain-containing protein [Streptomyces sp. NPDC002405]|uniref:STAS domain-containing protein n=1 Tax=Streptomyces sp. NPDC001231 TaxID=3364549 RepID=UPI00367FDF88
MTPRAEEPEDPGPGNARMTTMPPSPFSLSAETRGSVVVVRVGGDLDYLTHGQLLDAVTVVLTRRHAARHPVADIRLEFSRLGSVDSSGLSALLQIRRLVDEAGVALHLDERPAVLDRLLDMTGTLELLTCPPENRSPPENISAPEDATRPARPPAT